MLRVRSHAPRTPRQTSAAETASVTAASAWTASHGRKGERVTDQALNE